MSVRPSSNGLPLAAVGVSVVLWSSAYVLSAGVLDSASPAVLSVGRFAIALVVLVPLAARRGGLWRVLRRPRTALLGLTGVTLYYSLANIGLTLTTPGTAALAAALLPALTAAAAVILLRERLPRRTIAGLVLATLGVGLVASSGLRLDLGVLLNILALAAYALYTVFLRQDASNELTSDKPDALVLATATGIWGTVIMLPWLATELIAGTASLPVGTAAIASILFLGLVVSAPTLVLYNYGAERLPAAVSGVATAAIPPLGYLLAIVLGEAPDALKAVGGIVALTGVLVATLATPGVEPSPPGSALPAPEDTSPDTPAGFGEPLTTTPIDLPLPAPPADPEAGAGAR